MPSRLIEDAYGYGRIPAFWFTLNLPFNYLYEIHRFQHATEELARRRQATDSTSTAQDAATAAAAVSSDSVDCLDPVGKEAMEKRCNWVLNNPDIVVMLHVLRVEIIVNYVMRHVVPPSEEKPFQYWLRFEFGQSGNPHAHGFTYVVGNPEFDLVVRGKEALEEALKSDHPDVGKMELEEDAERGVAAFFDQYIREKHPCKDAAGASLWHFEEPLYTLMVENVSMPGCAKP